MNPDERDALVRRIRLLADADPNCTVLTRAAQCDADNLGRDFDDVCDCLGALKVSDLEEVREDAYVPGAPLAIFSTHFEGDHLYVKVRVSDGLTVLSFKLYGSPR